MEIKSMRQNWGGRKLYIEVTGKLLESAWIVFISFVHGTYPKRINCFKENKRKKSTKEPI